MVITSLMRPCPEMKQMIDNIRAHYIMRGKRPPSIKKITKAFMIRYKMKKEDLLYDEAIFF